MNKKSRFAISHALPILFALAAIAVIYTGCASTPSAPQIDPIGQITGIELPGGCGPVQLKITMSQDAPLTPGGTGARVEGGGIVSNGTLKMPDLSGFDLSKTVKIDAEVVVGNCAPFIPPSAWHFESTLNSLGGSKYSVDFSKFQKTH